jgi:hypothetical protein
VFGQQLRDFRASSHDYVKGSLRKNWNVNVFGNPAYDGTEWGPSVHPVRQTTNKDDSSDKRQTTNDTLRNKRLTKAKERQEQELVELELEQDGGRKRGGGGGK